MYLEGIQYTARLHIKSANIYTQYEDDDDIIFIFFLFLSFDKSQHESLPLLLSLLAFLHRVILSLELSALSSQRFYFCSRLFRLCFASCSILLQFSFRNAFFHRRSHNPGFIVRQAILSLCAQSLSVDVGG